jgi:bacteriocin biosynthesis cyclodehydratase domain-containing protein
VKSRPVRSSAGSIPDRADDELTVAQGLDLLFIGDNEVLVQFGTRSRPSELLRDSELTGVLRRVLYPLKHGVAAREALLGQFDIAEREEAETLLNGLIEKGIVTTRSTSPVDQYLGFSVEQDRHLAEARVAVIGAGPLGARIAHSLVQHGVGYIRLLDERAADDLWRTFLPLATMVSPPDGQAAQEALRDLLLRVGIAEVSTTEGGFGPDGVTAAVADVDLAVLATEQPHPRLAHLVNRACLRADRPWLTAGIDGNVGLIGPLFLPPETACYNDFETLARSTRPDPAMDRAYHRYLLNRGTGSFFPGLPSYADVVSGFTVVGTVQQLLRGTSHLLARLVSIDFETMQVDVEDVLRLPRCPVCSEGRAAEQPPFPPAERPDLEG